jgi:hypothetical protein
MENSPHTGTGIALGASLGLILDCIWEMAISSGVSVSD